MINRILIELFDDYKENNNIDKLIEFTNKTFSDEDARKVFIGCTVVLFSFCNGYKPRYSVTRERLLEIVLSIKEKIGNTNLLRFYVLRLNTNKNVVKYFKNIKSESEYDNGANIVIDYLEQFKPNFINSIKKYEEKINEFIKNDV